MRILATLIQIHQANPSPMLKQWLQKNHHTKMVQLYHGIGKGKLNSDIQASQFLYQDVNHPNYRRLKTLLKEKLLDLMLYLPVSDEELDCIELKYSRNAYIKALFKQKVSTEQALLEEVDLVLA